MTHFRGVGKGRAISPKALHVRTAHLCRSTEPDRPAVGPCLKLPILSPQMEYEPKKKRPAMGRFAEVEQAKR